MSDSSQAQSKTEAPTPKRREEARKQGQVASSTELSTGVMMLAGIFALSFGAPTMGERLMLLVAYPLRFPAQGMTIPQTIQLATIFLNAGLGIVGALLVSCMMAGVGATVLQIGFRLSPEALGIKWSRLSPANGLQRMFSVRTFVRGSFAPLKLCVVAVVVPWTLYSLGPKVLLQGGVSLRGALQGAWEMAIFTGYLVAGIQFAVGLADFLFQRWQHEQDLRMTRRDILDEQKREDGDPQIKPRMRKMQRDAALARQMLSDVTTASFVLTNPTHLAVAVRYERGVMPAPIVVAKGEGLLAKRIARKARELNIPVLERKPLARALYGATAVGQEIPAALYRAIAEVLAYVYKLK